MFALPTLLCVLGLWGLFVARVFGPLFVLAVSARLALRAPGVVGLDLARLGLADFGFEPLAQHALPWFVGDDFVLIVGALAALELAANHVAALRARLRRHDGLPRAAAAVVAALGLGIARDHGALDAALPSSVTLALQSQPWLQGTVEPAIIALLVSLGVLVVGRLRRSVLARVAEQERGDPLGVGWLIAWTEELWSVVWPPLFVLVPPASLAALAIALVALLRLRAALRFRDDDDKVICVCGQANYRTAPRCAGCGGRNAAPADVGRLGQALTTFASDLDAHARALYEVCRCPRCAAPLEARAPQQFCTACGQAAPPDALFVSAYDRAIRRRTGRALLGTALWGALPLVGLVPGIFFAHRRLIAPYARFTALRSLFSRGLLRLVWLVAVVVQLVPGAGAVSLPLMAYTSHRAHRSAYLKGSTPSPDEDDW